MIKTENLSMVFTTEEVQTKALNEVNIEVKQSEFVAIMGPSGCGKSTLLNILGTLDSPTSGKYFFNGKEIELIIWHNGTAYPMAIKKSAYPSKAVKTFAILEPVSADAKIQIGAGGIVCLIDDLLPASDNLYYIPAWVL